MPPSKHEDDFVLTISDNDELDASEVESEPEAKPVLKRKRAGKDVQPAKKQKNNHVSSEAESESEEEEAVVDDGAFDSDFEFDFGGQAIEDTVDDFDGWGESNDAKAVSKKGVDLDEILARRVKKKLDVAGKAQAQEPDLAASGPDNDQDIDELGEITFHDDENLADDAFGANVDTEEDEPVDSEGSEAEAKTDDENDDAEDSDHDSTASPVAHPDDLASDDSDNERNPEDDAEEMAKRKAFFADESEHKPTLNDANSFSQFSLSRPLMRALGALNFTSPTPIQSRAIPVALQGLDVVGSAQTGSGKTAAFLLPILERLMYRPRKIPTTRVAILMPTRELAVQCYSVAVALARFTDITFAQVVGGFSVKEQETILKKRPDVVIATPGRFIDHMRNSASFAVENLEILVLDEADRMLEQGFTDELDEILKTIPRSRQTMLFSATMTSSVDKLVRVGMNKPVRLSVDTTHSTVAGLTQEFLRLRPGRDTPEVRLATLCMLVTTIPDFQQRTIIFFRQKKEAHRIRVVLGLLGIRAGELHGSLTQEQRITAVNDFRDGKTTHLLATDVASRGLDIKNVLTVINFEAPQTHEIYLHRVGRTARAGKSGRSCTIAAEPDRKVVKAAVKSARDQGEKVTSRVLDHTAVDEMNEKILEMADEIEDVLKEEKQEKQISQMEAQVTRGENLVKHHDEIMSRPKRTWFESEKEKQANKDRAKAEMNALLFKGEKKKLSNKDKKKLDLSRDRKDGRQWKKGKEDAEASVKDKKHKKGKTGIKSKPKMRTR